MTDMADMADQADMVDMANKADRAERAGKANMVEIMTDWLAHWPTHSTNYKEMLSHLKNIYWSMVIGNNFV